MALQLVVIRDDVITAPVFFVGRKCEVAFLRQIECPVWHVDSAETVDVFRIF